MAKEASDGREPILDLHDKPHYHTNPRNGGHIWWASAYIPSFLGGDLMAEDIVGWVPIASWMADGMAAKDLLLGHLANIKEEEEKNGFPEPIYWDPYCP